MTASTELPLVAFTVLSQCAIGITLLYTLRTATTGQAEANAGRQWLLATVLLGIGLLLSLLHLGHPLQAPRALSNLATSWLSREVLLTGALLGLMAAVAWRLRQQPVVLLVAALGLLTLFVQGRVYSPPGMPALNNAYPFAFFLLTAVSLGAGVAAWFAPAPAQPLVRGVLIGALCMGLLLYLVAPLAWLQSGTVERMTAQQWFGSAYYWVQVILGLALPLIIVLVSRQVPRWLPVLLLLGAVAGRIGFYADTVHAAANMGGLY